MSDQPESGALDAVDGSELSEADLARIEAAAAAAAADRAARHTGGDRPREGRRVRSTGRGGHRA